MGNQKRGTRAAVFGGAAGLIPAISLAFYWFLLQEPDVAEQRAGYVALALLFLSPYMFALIASRSLAGNPDSPQAGVLLTSISDEIVDVATYYRHYHAI